MDSQIKRLQERYRRRVQSKGIDSQQVIRRMHGNYRDRYSNVMDAMAIACSVSHVVAPQGIDVSNLTPEMREAFHLQYPHMSMDALQHMTPDELQGVLNGWTSKLFEVVVRDKLNNGEWVGNIHLHDGLHAVLAQSATQPGWDLEIINPNGVPVEFLQMKATSSLSYIKEALDKYPQFHIVATSDIFNNGSHISDTLMHHITNSGISDDQLRDTMSHVLDHENGIHDYLADILPEFTFIMIGLTELYSVIRRGNPLKEAFASSADRSLKSGTVMAVVHGLEALGAGTGATIPAAIVMRLSMSRISVFHQLAKQLKARNEQLRRWSRTGVVLTRS